MLYNQNESVESLVALDYSPENMTMMVTKRNGKLVAVSFDKIIARISKLCFKLENVDPIIISQKVVAGLYHGVKTSKLDELAAETAAYMSTVHPEYSRLAARIAVSNMHKMTNSCISSIFEFLNVQTREFMEEFKDVINEELGDYKKDFNYDYFGYRTLSKSYLLRDKVTDAILERPQCMLMRISCAIHAKQKNIDLCLETYNYMSNGYFTHATPTMFNAGTKSQQLASCFLNVMKDDSIDGIFSTIRDFALISKSSGGIGSSISNIRCKGSKINSSNGTSSGIVPMCRVINNTATYVDQGGGKRKGAIALYLEPWHGDIEDFLELRKNHGNEEMRARDLFYALWIPDLFMKRVENNEEWSLFCPSKCPDLPNLVGKEFDEKYELYESQGIYVKKIPAQKLWFQILDSQMETGTPYMLYKDAANLKSNQKNLGTIKCSNLCTEIIEYSDSNETAVCNLASIALPKFANEDGSFNFKELGKVVQIVTRNLNIIIDENLYPLESTYVSNNRHRPIGLGVQGLADLFMMMHIPFESDSAKKLNSEIFECIYYNALIMSCKLSKLHGPYETFKGSPASMGILQFDMWEDSSTSEDLNYDWTTLKSNIQESGLRNSLLVAPMPTASTAQILGNSECFEPITSNLYVRRVLSGEFPVVNKYLVNYLKKIDKWNVDTCQKIIENKGSVQDLEFLDDNAKEVFKTVWEIKMKNVIDMAADRGKFIDQSQSMNLFMDYPTHKRLSSMHFYAWKRGLKTGMYYLRTKPATDALQVTVSPSSISGCESCSA